MSKEEKSKNIVFSERISIYYIEEYPHKEENAYSEWAVKWLSEVIEIKNDLKDNDDVEFQDIDDPIEVEIDVLCSKDAAADLPDGLSVPSSWVANGASTVSRETREQALEWDTEREADINRLYEEQSKLNPPLKLIDKNGNRFKGKS